VEDDCGSLAGKPDYIMAVLIEIPVVIYQTFLGRCPSLSREYELLRNSIVSRTPIDVRLAIVVECLCELDDAELLLTRAKVSYPLASSYIEEGLRLAQKTFDVSQIEYRKTAVENIWHFSSNCSYWPTANFVLSKDVSYDSTLCDECFIKTRMVNA
jgi:hypothetical protein